ncbi:MAG: hypothetical protein IT492_16845 [Gammaproteobacteria bacterium]|nr:hypothetical protein [Gammaproteobacteria bacterium]
MFRVVDCIALQHDRSLLVIAGLICLFGSVATVLSARRLDSRHHAWRWRALVAVCVSSTVWATHFLAMLAYRPTLSVAFDLPQTVLSYFIGLMVMGPALVSARCVQGLWLRMLCGVVFGAGVALMHYLGMAAVQVAGLLSYDAPQVALSVILSCAGGAMTVSALFGPRTASRRLLAIFALALTILALHFTGMSAVSVSLNSLLAHTDSALSRQLLVIETCMAAAAVLGITLLGAQFDEHMARALREEAARFRTLADGAFEGLIIHRDDTIVDYNAVACTLLGHSTLNMPFASLFPDGLLHESANTAVKTAMQHRDGHHIAVEINRRPIHTRTHEWAELVAIRDLTAQQAVEGKLAEAMENLGALRALIPMCAWCKRVRDDEGYWNAVDHYLKEVTGNEITHGICPTCSDKELARLGRG